MKGINDILRLLNIYFNCSNIFVFIFNNEVKGDATCSYELNLPEIFAAIYLNTTSEKALYKKDYTYVYGKKERNHPS